MRLDDVAWDDEQEPLDDAGKCELSAGVEVTPSGHPRVRLCGKPATLRGIAYMCDECHARWRANRERKNE